MIIGHERQIKYLDKVLKRERLAHAFLFYGPEQVGKRTTALTLAKTLYCKVGEGLMEGVCDECSSCRKIDAGVHPAVMLLGREQTLVSKKEKRKEIPIEDIRELKRRFSFAPQGNEWRMAIIDDAHLMSQEAADAFLKMLEEPGERTLFILIAPNRELLPPTISSRAQPLRFALVPDAVLEKKFDGLIKWAKDKKSKKEILALAQGRPGIMFSLVKDPELLSGERVLLQNLLSLLKQKNISDIFKLTEEIAGDEEVSRKAVEYMLRILRKELLKSAATGMVSSLLGKIKRIEEVNFIRETTNVNPRLALDILFLTAIS